MPILDFILETVWEAIIEATTKKIFVFFHNQNIHRGIRIPFCLLLFLMSTAMTYFIFQLLSVVHVVVAQVVCYILLAFFSYRAIKYIFFTSKSSD